MDLLLRFVIGGVVVSAFALIGDLLKPKSFAGLFGAAPSVALATLALTVAKHGHPYAAIEGRAMLAGAIALLLYSWMVCQLLMRSHLSCLSITLWSLPAWFAAAFLLRPLIV